MSTPSLLYSTSDEKGYKRHKIFSVTLFFLQITQSVSKNVDENVFGSIPVSD